MITQFKYIFILAFFSMPSFAIVNSTPLKMLCEIILSPLVLPLILNFILNSLVLFNQMTRRNRSVFMCPL